MTLGVGATFSTSGIIQRKEVASPKYTTHALLVIVSNVLSFNILNMFVADIRKEFYEVVANQVGHVFFLTMVMERLVTHSCYEKVFYEAAV